MQYPYVARAGCGKADADHCPECLSDAVPPRLGVRPKAAPQGLLLAHLECGQAQLCSTFGRECYTG